jgi:Mrp family chromosome partitioning ATPase/capsular polysaccharide biosynthesis protein
VSLNELLQVFWRRKLLIVLVVLGVLVPAYIATQLVTPKYESTATLSLTPKSSSVSDLVLFGVFDTVMPFYAEAGSSSKTLADAAQRLGRPLCPISVETFKGTGIMKIKARCAKPRLAQLSAAAATGALLNRVSRNQVGIPSLKLLELDPPALPTTPVFPRTRLTLFVAALLGLGLGLGAALLRENLTTKVETADDLASTSGAPVFAEIPAEAAILKMHSPEDLAINPRLRVVAEALRDLRTNLLFTDESIRSIVVTSPDGSHGKTTVAFALAATLARAGAKTILVDADLRRGRVAELLEVPGSPGLMDVLLGEVDLKDAIRPSRDSVIPISDARIVARYADATVLVARAGGATRRQVRAAVERLALISVKPTAAVLNHSSEVSRSSYYVRPNEPDVQTRGARRLARKQRGAASS